MSSPASRRSPDKILSPHASPAPNQYPFPQSPSPQASTSTSLSGKRRESTTSSFSASSRTSATQAQKTNTIAETSSNAISVLLQPPITRTGLAPHATLLGSSKQPTAKDIPPVTLTDIPKVKPSAFSSYLKQAGALYDAFQRAKEDDINLLEQGSRPSSKDDKHPPSLVTSHVRRKSSVPSTPIIETSTTFPLSPTDQPHARRRVSGRRRGPLPAAPLATIPSVYFETGFQLENPRTFDIVSERSEVIRRPSVSDGSNTSFPGGRKVLATNAILQEKLSWYMDTVEVHLISSISTASSSFFAALGNLRELHAEAAASVAKIKEVRSDLASLDKNMAQGGLKIITLQRRRENMQKLGNAILQLREIVSAVSACESQVEKDDVENAIASLSKAESLIAGTKPMLHDTDRSQDLLAQEHLIDLRSIRALKGSADDISFLRGKIGKIFETRFLDALLGDLRRHVDTVPARDTLERWDTSSQRARGMHGRKPSAFPAYMHMDAGLRSVLQSNLEGLAKCDCLKQATAAYRDALWREIKQLIRKHLPSSSDDDMESTMSASTQGGRRLTQQEKSSILARNLRDLEMQDAEDMLRKIYSNVGEALRRLGTQVKVVLDVTSTFGAQPSRSNVTSPRSPPVGSGDSYMNVAAVSSIAQVSFQQEDIQQTLDMSTLLGQSVDIAQAQTTKVLKVRSDQTVHLPLPLFLRYFNLNRLFADECEAVSGRGGVALRTIVNSQIKDFVRLVGDTQRQRLVEGIDRDRWDAKEFTEDDSQYLGEVLTASTRNVETWPKGDVVSAEPAMTNGEQQANGVAIKSVDQSAKDRIRSATIDEQKFILPETAITVLRSISYFQKVIAGIPSMTQEITLSLLEYLKLFNSRSSQLILGAGATRSAGLKNITTKHLALASQALSFVTSLLPYIREFIRRHQTNPQGLMIEFDKVKRLYQEHQHGINEKLVDIMSTRATTHVNTMKKIDWDNAKNNDGISTYMETLVKETTTLHKVLSKHLPETTVRAIMDPVFESYRKQWHAAFEEVNVATAVGRDRIMRDLRYFQSRMSKLEGGAGVGDTVVDVVRQKPIVDDNNPTDGNGSDTKGSNGS